MRIKSRKFEIDLYFISFLNLSIMYLFSKLKTELERSINRQSQS